jgi:hypothetical protein
MENITYMAVRASMSMAGVLNFSGGRKVSNQPLGKFVSFIEITSAVTGKKYVVHFDIKKNLAVKFQTELTKEAEQLVTAYEATPQNFNFINE